MKSLDRKLEDGMKVATWNVNGIRARQTQFAEWVARDRPDVICLQEIKATLAQIPAEICELPGYTCYWHAAGAYSGVSLHFRSEAFKESPDYSHPPFDLETRFVQARVGDIVFASVYVPNGGKDFEAKIRFLESMRGYVEEVHAAGLQLVMCGDMNVARTDRDVHPKERKPNIVGQRPDERALFERVISSGLVDVGRALDPDNENLFTWWAPWRNLRQRNIGWRLDYILVTEQLAKRATNCTVLREFGTSDHGAVVAEFS